ncbi:hypothetical protein NDU88_008155 [Pleurodeles waltl]|uniref:GAGE domain-containing protein n=1 Tax=Pleurodeles waltl TaxID=8319 RepID=A0AAV7RV86_PLEWA|nr:hypothetical protein NDU88_008155 [Pleurodeles waltl]
MTPDFQIPGVVKGENGLRRGVEEEGEDAEEPEETADGGLEQPGRRPGNPDVPRETEDPVQEGRRKGDAQKPPRPRRGVAEQGTVLF